MKLFTLLFFCLFSMLAIGQQLEFDFGEARVPTICKSIAYEHYKKGPKAPDFMQFIVHEAEFFDNPKLTPQMRGELSFAYFEVHRLYKNSRPNILEAEKLCNSILKKNSDKLLSLEDDARKAKGVNDLAGTYITPFKNLDAAVKIQSQQNSSLCQSDFKNSDLCTSILPTFANLEVNFLQFIQQVSGNTKGAGIRAYDEQDCICLEDKVSKKTTTQNIAKETAVELEKLEDSIYRASSIKAVNSLAATIEDLRYYGGMKADVLLDKGQEKADMDQRLCVSPAGLKKEVDELCARNGMTAGSDQRMSEVLGSLNPEIKKLGFNEALRAFNDDVGTLNVKVKENGKDVMKAFDRFEHDKARRTLGINEPQLIFANTILTKILKSDILGKKLKDEVEEGNIPVGAIIDLLDSDDPKVGSEVDKILADLKFKFRQKGSPIFDNLIKEKAARNPDDLEKDSVYVGDLKDLFHKAQVFNPGFKNLMNDSSLFSKIQKDFRPKDSSMNAEGLMGIMEGGKDDLMEKLAERCKESQRLLAATVCTPKATILRSVRIIEIDDLIDMDPIHKAKKGNKDAMDMAICSLYQNRIETNSNSPFRHLGVEKLSRDKRSDYYDSRVHPNDQTNGFHDIAKMLQNKDAAERIREDYKYSSQGVKSLDRFKSVAKSDSDQFTVGDGGTKSYQETQGKTSAPSLPEAPASRDIASVDNFTPAASNEARSVAAAGPYIAPAALPNAVAAIPAEQKNEAKNDEYYETKSRDKLSRELGNSETKERVKEHLNSMSEKDAEEVLRLRDQARKDSDTIAQFRIEQERNKKDALKGQYDEMKARYDKLTGSSAATPESSDSGFSVSSGGVGSSADGRFNQFDKAAHKNTFAASQASGGKLSGAISASPTASAGAIGDSGSGTSNATGAGAVSTSVTTAGAADASGFALTVTQSVGADGKSFARAEDPNQVLISYLSKNESSIEQLQNLKMSGLVLTEEDVTKDGKKIQVKKTIKFNDLSPETKSFIEKKLAQVRLNDVKRNYSRQVLLFELFNASGRSAKL